MATNGKERNVSDRLKHALSGVGAVLKRSKKHLVYELPNGKSFTLPSTPSDTRADLNAISDLRKVAGVVKEVKPPRKERREKQGRREADWTLPVNTMASALKSAKVVDEQFYLDRIAALESENARISAQSEAYGNAAFEFELRWQALRRSRWVRLGRWLRVVT